MHPCLAAWSVLLCTSDLPFCRLARGEEERDETHSRARASVPYAARRSRPSGEPALMDDALSRLSGITAESGGRFLGDRGCKLRNAKRVLQSCEDVGTYPFSAFSVGPSATHWSKTLWNELSMLDIPMMLGGENPWKGFPLPTLTPPMAGFAASPFQGCSARGMNPSRLAFLLLWDGKG